MAIDKDFWAGVAKLHDERKKASYYYNGDGEGVKMSDEHDPWFDLSEPLRQKGKAAAYHEDLVAKGYPIETILVDDEGRPIIKNLSKKAAAYYKLYNGKEAKTLDLETLDKLPPGVEAQKETWPELTKKEAAYYKMHHGEVKEAKVKEKITTHKRYGEKNITVGAYVMRLWSDSPSKDMYPMYTCEVSFGTYGFFGRDATCAKKAVNRAVNAFQKHHGYKEEELEIKG